MNHYPRHIGDITRDTFGLSPTEFGCYDRLLDAYYATEGPLPMARTEHHRLAGCRSPSDRKACDYVVDRYFTQGPDGWHQKRADKEIATYSERSAKASASASMRWSERNADAMRTHTEGNASQKPIASNHKADRASRLPEDWTPTEELRNFALQHLSPGAFTLETTKFKNHWRAKAGRDGAKLDWAATFENWVLNALKYGAEPAPARYVPKFAV